MENKLSTVQEILVQTLKKLTEKNQSPEDKKGAIEESKAVTGIATAYVDAVKVEIVYAQMTHIVSPTLQETMGYLAAGNLDLKKLSEKNK